MTVTINLPQNAEQAYLVAARAKGVSVDALVSDVLLSHVPVAEAGQQSPVSSPQLIKEHGVTVLRTGQPLSASVVNDALQSIRRERDFAALGSF
jgi:hypothetical protein